MSQGVIKKLVTDKGFGFIKGEREELFFHHSAVQGCSFEELREGQTVQYTEGRGPKGPRAESAHGPEFRRRSPLADVTSITAFARYRGHETSRHREPAIWLSMVRYGARSLRLPNRNLLAYQTVSVSGRAAVKPRSRLVGAAVLWSGGS